MLAQGMPDTLVTPLSSHNIFICAFTSDNNYEPAISLPGLERAAKWFDQLALTANFRFGTARFSISLRLISPAAKYIDSFPSALVLLSTENSDNESIDGLDFR